MNECMDSVIRTRSILYQLYSVACESDKPILVILVRPRALSGISSIDPYQIQERELEGMKICIYRVLNTDYISYQLYPIPHSQMKQWCSSFMDFYRSSIGIRLPRPAEAIVVSHSPIEHSTA